jgi:radical SAM superfamily enzyme YgiQ (UPF0313 family)
MKIEIIVPSKKTFFPNRWRRVIHVFSLTGPAIAAAMPPDVEVSLTEQSVEDIDFDKDIDMVAISTRTSTALEAYRIADTYLDKRKDVSVILGGIHASMLPEEAIRHAHSVVIGESDELWPKIIEDYRKGALKRFYRCTSLPDMSRLRLPKRELLAGKSLYAFNTVQMTRGCPYSCHFCSVHLFSGGKYRTRPVDDVIEEIRGIKSRYLFFLDDNPSGNVRYTKELYSKMIGLKKKWYTQAHISFADDDKLLLLAKRAGLTMASIGFESVVGESLESTAKPHVSLRKYRENVKKIQKHGVIVLGSFIFGFDGDDDDVFDRTIRFAQECKIDHVSFHILTPYPGTALRKQLESEGRLIDSMGWDKHDTAHAVFTPKLMGQDPRRLEQGFRWAYREFYSARSILKRLKLNRHLALYLSVSLCLYYATRRDERLTEGKEAEGRIKRMVLALLGLLEKKVLSFSESSVAKKRAPT